jgi:hypothetical protein
VTQAEPLFVAGRAAVLLVSVGLRERSAVEPVVALVVPVGSAG